MYRLVEEISLKAWPAFETIDHHDWLIRFADGYTKRANSVTVLDRVGSNIEEKINYCESQYRERRQKPIFRLLSFTNPMMFQLGVGEDYTLLNPVIALTITDFEMFSGNDRIISRYRLKEKDDLTDYSDDIELVFVELPKFTKELDDLESLVDKWLYFLKAANKLSTVPAKMGEIPAINHAFLVAQQSKFGKI